MDDASAQRPSPSLLGRLSARSILLQKGVNIVVDLVFCAAATTLIVIVDRSMRSQAMAGAQEKARILVERSLAIHTRYAEELEHSVGAILGTGSH